MFAMPVTFVITTWITFAISLILLVIEVRALVLALRFPAAAYDAAGKRTKGFWGGLTGGAVFVGVLGLAGGAASLGGFALMLELAAIVVAGVFLADVLPSLRIVMGNAQGNYRR